MESSFFQAANLIIKIFLCVWYYSCMYHTIVKKQGRKKAVRKKRRKRERKRGKEKGGKEVKG